MYLTVLDLAEVKPEAAVLSWVGATKPSLDMMILFTCAQVECRMNRSLLIVGWLHKEFIC